MPVPDLIALIVLIVGLVKLARSPVAAAIGERVRGGRAAAADPMLLAELDELRGRLAEVEDRLDFAERQLAQAHAEALPGGAHR